MPNNVKTKSTKEVKSTNAFVAFFQGLKAEFKRITWPNYDKTKKTTITVILFCFMFVVVTGLLDEVFKRFFSFIFTK